MHQVKTGKEVSVACTRFHENHEEKYSNAEFSLKNSDITSETPQSRIQGRVAALGMAFTAELRLKS